MMKFAMVLLVGVFVVCLSACNTVEGIGEDFEAGGEAIQDAVD